MSQPEASKQAKFLTGNMMGHVVTMTLTSTVGIISLFAVDVLNLFYISQLGTKQLAAAIGYAGTLQFFFVSLAIGMSIFTGAIVSRALGQGSSDKAAVLSGASIVFSFVSMAVVVAICFPFLPQLVGLLDAEGETKEAAIGFLRIVLPSLPLLSFGMACSGVLRAIGDAKGAMYVVLSGGLISAVFDPIFIIWMDWGINGAATATVLSRMGFLMLGGWFLIGKHGLFKFPDMQAMIAVSKPFWTIGIPAIMTQLATPLGNAYVTAAFASYGDDAVAGWAVIGRLLPLSFAAIFALSGAVGPIIGQNFGAGNRKRVLLALKEALIFSIGYVLVVWLILYISADFLADAFNVPGVGRELVQLFCVVIAGTFVFMGFLFVANAAFNNLGFALYSTLFNWGRATIGVVPFVYFGGKWFGAQGVLLGWGLGGVAFGLFSVIVAFKVVAKMEMKSPDDNSHDDMPDDMPSDNSPFDTARSHSAFSSGKAAGL